MNKSHYQFILVLVICFMQHFYLEKICLEMIQFQLIFFIMLKFFANYKDSFLTSVQIIVDFLKHLIIPECIEQNIIFLISINIYANYKRGIKGIKLNGSYYFADVLDHYFKCLFMTHLRET